jgi:hypothetical protein
MKNYKKNRIQFANIILEQNYLSNKILLKEYDTKELDSKKQNVLSVLTYLKDKNPSFGDKIQKHIDTINSAQSDKICDGTKLRTDLQTKLDDAKGDLKMKAFIKDPENKIDGLTSDISFIETFCSKQTATKPETTTSQPTATKPETTTNQPTTTKPETTSQPTTSQPTTTLVSPSVSQATTGKKFLDALESLKKGEFTKNDIVDYVKSRVQIRNS